MAQTAIFGPFFATMLVTLLVWVYMYVRRIGFITKTDIGPRDLAVPGKLARLSPAAVSNPSDSRVFEPRPGAAYGVGAPLERPGMVRVVLRRRRGRDRAHRGPLRVMAPAEAPGGLTPT